MSISIVTAFYDIGRGDWTPDKGLPHYLQRSTDTYLERFSHLAKLKNEIIVFTSADLAEKVEKVCYNRMENTKIVVLDVFTHFAEMRKDIEAVQKSEDFQKIINPAQAKNPEYWNPDYVMVTNLKAFFVHMAIQNNIPTNDMVSWIDFGYCRSEANIPASKEWNYSFDPEKIHMFNYKDYDDRPIGEIIANNDVYILGAKVVAHKSKWETMAKLMHHSYGELMRNGYVDDDQGLWLISYLLKKELFELHRIPDHQLGHDPFVLFNQFNETL
jgi:protein YibB